MKTPEDIKNELKCMGRHWRGWSLEEVANATLAYIEQLEEQLAHTCNLVDILSHREGVERIDVEPYQESTTQVDGPAVILIIRD